MDMESAVRKLGGVWPFDRSYRVLYWNKPREVFTSESRVGDQYTVYFNYRIGTIEEFDATTDRLRNEPSFDDAPDWAVAKAQDDDGEWYWYEGYTELRSGLWYGGRYKTSLASKGEVIGDWRGTLRLRPEEKGVEEKPTWSTKVGFPDMEEDKEMMKTIEDAVRDNNGEWPGDHPLSEVLVWAESSWNAWSKEWVGKEFYDWYEVCTRTEFNECTARLRNEPSWDDAPIWAKAKAQDSDGEWYWYGVEPEIAHNCFANSPMSEIASRGEVIGDWRYTLRLRPEEMEVKKNQMNATEAVYGFAGWLTSRKEKVCFSSTTEASTAAELAGEFCSVNELPEISDNWPDNLVHPKSKEVEEADWKHRGEFPVKEDNEVFEADVVREQLDREGVPRISNPLPFFPEGAIYSLWGRVKRYAEMAVEAEKKKMAEDSAPKNNWHERGEFPPVGAVCEVFPWFHICESVAPHRDGMVMHDRRNDEYFLATKNTRFRPIQTERERLIEKACKVAVDSYCIEDTVKSLADAGMLKMPEEKPE